MLAEKQRDRRGSDRTACPPVRPSASPPPRHPSHHAERIEQGRVVLRDPGGQHLGLPGSGRNLEAIQLCDDGSQTLEAGCVLVCIDPLPCEQKPHEVGRTRRLDLGAQFVQSVPVDPGEQATVAPFERGRPAVPGTELPPEDHALALQRGQRDIGVGLVDVERSGQTVPR